MGLELGPIWWKAMTQTNRLTEVLATEIREKWYKIANGQTDRQRFLHSSGYSQVVNVNEHGRVHRDNNSTKRKKERMLADWFRTTGACRPRNVRRKRRTQTHTSSPTAPALAASVCADSLSSPSPISTLFLIIAFIRLFFPSQSNVCKLY